MKIAAGFIVGAFINVVFWVLYTATGDIIASIAITAIVSAGFIATLKMLGKRKL